MRVASNRIRETIEDDLIEVFNLYAQQELDNGNILSINEAAWH